MQLPICWHLRCIVEFLTKKNRLANIQWLLMCSMDILMADEVSSDAGPVNRECQGCSGFKVNRF